MSDDHLQITSSTFMTEREQVIVRKCVDGTCPCVEKGRRHAAIDILETAVSKCGRLKADAESFEWLLNRKLGRVVNGPPKVKEGWKPPEAPSDDYKLEAFHDGDEWILVLTNETDSIDVDWPFEGDAWDCDLEKIGFEVIE